MVASASHTFSGCSTVELPDRLGVLLRRESLSSYTKFGIDSRAGDMDCP
jgi:hypothetical protein